MIEQLPESSDNIIRVRASGKLNHEDFTKLFSLIDAAVGDGVKTSLLIELHDFHGWDLHGLLDDFKFHALHCSAIERIAYVGDKAWERLVVGLAKVFPGTAVRYFDVSEADAIKAWLERD